MRQWLLWCAGLTAIAIGIGYWSETKLTSAANPPLKQTPSLSLPIAGMKASDLRDSFNERRGNVPHEATDIPAPRGTPVLAVEDGSIRKLFLSKPGGVTIYQFDPTEQFCYYYAHLDRYASGLAEGMKVQRGQVIGYVGTTGNAPPNAPHLHFAISVLGPEKLWYKGTAIDPYPFLRAALDQRAK